MEKSNKISFLSSITTKVTMLLMATFTAVIVIVFYVVSNEGYDKVKSESEKIAIASGKLTVSYISTELKAIESSADKIRDNSEILPLQKGLLEKSLSTVLNQDTSKVTDAGIIARPELQSVFPTLHQHLSDSHNEYSNQLNNKSNQKSNQKPAAPAINTENPLLNIMAFSQPNNCFWGHSESSNDIKPTLTSHQSDKQTHISCAMPITRDNEFWGMAEVKTSSSILTNVLKQVNNELKDSYSIIFDNNNEIIATSDESKIPIFQEATGKPISINDVGQINNAWKPLINKINENRKKTIAVTKPLVLASVITELELLDVFSNAEQGSMLLNFAANQRVSNSDIFGNIYIDKITLTNDYYSGNDSSAYVFVIPETNWNLVIVQSQEQINTVAADLSKNIIKYLMFALLVMLALIFFMMDYLALRPMEETSKLILEADNFINKNRYNKLSSITFPKIRNDEMGIVNGSLKKLLNRIESNEGKLANINQSLEIKVEERTKELKNAMHELKSSQVQLIRSEKMATLGQMVAGVAHEVNTPLTYVQNNVEIIGQLAEQYEELIEMLSELKALMVNESTSDDDIEDLMGEIIELSQELEEDEISSELKELIKDSLFGVEQITEMVLNLRNFARIDESKVKQIDLRECIKTSLKIAQNSIKHMKINTHLLEIPNINCSPSQINQVIINLLNNASQAIGNKTDGQIDIKASSTNSHIFIDIKDNGSGMNEEVLSKLFEPFFTTKGAGEGTGLGMAISHQIMEQHNGEIKVKSKEGVGTLFRLIFPLDSQMSDIAT